MYKNYLFDLDGTLLPMDADKFIKLYFGSLCQRFVPVLKIDSDTLVKAIWAGTKAMVKNDNSKINKDVFWETASAVCNTDLTPYIEQFDDYYENEFIAAKETTGFTPYAKKCIDYIKENRGRLIAATNPIFPVVAQKRRLEWAGVDPDDFEFITSYDNSGSCKPNLKYYESICEKLNINPEESIMIGNDVEEDMCTEKLGFDTYLITDCLLNRENKDISCYRNGSFEEFYNYLTQK